MTSRSVLLVGATGLVGSHCLEILIRDPDVERIVVLTRRRLGEAMIRRAGAKIEEKIVDFEKLGDYADAFKVDAILCALGTTIRKAGTQERFRHVDYDYPMTIARAGLAQGARHFLLVSSLGAASDARVFYSRVKGELENSLMSLGYRTLTILRPSLLLGDRQEKRFGERFASWFEWLAPAKYRGVEAHDVAMVLVDELHDTQPGVQIIESAAIRDRAAELQKNL
ncbi:MAG: NAD(P)H-binding protein [Thermoanaerobaculia bacterium]